jgi:post-segregation antitoxin (ccd killing protein)
MVRKATAPAREKVSVTLERGLMDKVRVATDNVSAFVNEAVRDRLYFAQLDAELARLRSEGVEPDARAVASWRGAIQATKRRRGRRSARKVGR